MCGNITSLLDKVKENPILLDAIYQWATAPTGKIAVRDGFHPNHGLIKSNIIPRYNLTEEKAGEIYSELVKEIESTGFEFDLGFFDARDEVDKYFNKNDILKDTVLQRLEFAKDEEKYIVWFFCKTQDGSPIWNEGVRRFNRFEDRLHATFNIRATMSEVSNLLIKLGFLNKLEWVGSKIKSDRSKRGNELIFPHYLQSIAKNIDEYVTLPDLPDFRKLLDALFEKKRVEALVVMEDLLKNGWIEKQKLTGKIIPYPSIISEKNDVMVLNLRLCEPLKKYFFEKKCNEIKMVADGVDRILNQLSEKHYPDILVKARELFEGAKAWNIHTMNNSLSEKDIMLISTPWLTGEQMEVLKNEGSSRYTVILTSMMDIPKLNKVYRNVSEDNINKMSDDWIIVDEKMFEMVINGKPPELYNEIVEELKKIGFPIGGQVEGIETSEGGYKPPTGHEKNKQNALNLISNFEMKFREFIIEQLKIRYGEKWWKQGITEDIKKKCQDRLKRDIEDKIEYSELHNYMDFMDLYSLIDWKQNREIFKPRFPKNIGLLHSKLVELYQIRNASAHPRRDITDDDISKIKIYIKDINQWINNTAKRIEEQKPKASIEPDALPSAYLPPPSSTSDSLKIHIGDSTDETPIYWEPNGADGKPRLVSGNILITGGAGSGKTEALKSLLFELNKQGYICLALGFHPDLKIEGFNTLNITAKSDIGVNPLDFDSLDEDGGGLPTQIYNVVERLKESYPTIGDIQEASLIEILEEAYAKRGITEEKETWGKPCPNFEDVRAILEERISETGDKELLRLKNKLSKIFKFNIFSKPNTIGVKDLFSESTVLDLSKLPDDFRFLVADTILRKIYRNLVLRDPIGFDPNGKERFRIFIAIDEAKIIVPTRKDNPKAIINIFGTEARKFGVGFIVSSQLTAHFGDDVLGNMATKIALKPLKHTIAQDNAKELSINPNVLMDIKNPGEGFIRFSNEETKKVFIKSYEKRKEGGDL